MRVLGIDPGFSSLGYALVDLKGTDEVVVEGLGCIRTEKSSKKGKVLASDDNTRRARELFRALLPLMEGVVAICTESQSWPRNASSSAKVGMGWGVIAALSELMDVPILMASPQGLKRAVCGKATASKEEVQEAVDKRFGRDFGSELVDNGLAKTYHEHPYDALGAVLACLDDEVLRIARRLA